MVLLADGAGGWWPGLDVPQNMTYPPSDNDGPFLIYRPHCSSVDRDEV